ncbi:Uncharacterized protein Rs2_16082 [Raphanus sativus]|nr:Uncharacterized protein Rs2_16082 [Raphanus sativus]
MKKLKKQRTTQQPVPISPAINLFGSIEQQTSTTPKTSANKNKRKIANITPEHRSPLTSISSLARDRINVGDNDSDVQIPKKPRRNPPTVLKEITNISKTLRNDKANTKSNIGDDACEDHDSDDEDADSDYNVDFRGVLEEIDDSLEFDCSSQESSDTESEESLDDSVEPETCEPQTEFLKEPFIEAKTSTRASKQRKTKTVRKNDGKN